MLDVLEHLEAVSTAIFSRIEKTVEEQKGKLQTVQQRTQHSADRVKTLAGRKQATSVFSPPNYPVSTSLLVDQKPLFNAVSDEKLKMVHHKFNPGPSALKNVSCSQSIDDCQY